jgi:hypothetical protein
MAVQVSTNTSMWTALLRRDRVFQIPLHGAMPLLDRDSHFVIPRTRNRLNRQRHRTDASGSGSADFCDAITRPFFKNCARMDGASAFCCSGYTTK